MMQDNPFAHLIPQQPAGPAPADEAPGIIYGRRKEPTQFEINRDQRDAADQILQQRRFDEMLAREDAKTRRQNEQADRAALAASRLPGDKEKSLQEMVGVVTSLGRALKGFNPDYFGMGASLENTAQSYLNVGTPGQRDWWADFRATDNVVRNQLFGASLTAPEKQSFADTTVSPDMAPEQARQNIARRGQIARAGLKKYRTFLLENVYAQGPIDALIGDALAELDATEKAAQGDGEPIARERNSLTVDNLTDFVAGLSGRKYDFNSNRDLTYNGEVVPLISDEVANSQQYRAAYQRKFGEAPPLQVSVEGGDKAARSQLYSDLDASGRRDAVTDPFIRGIADIPTFGGADELVAAGQTIFGDGTMRDNLRRERGVTAYDEEYNAWPRLTGQLVGSLALPVPASATTAGRLAAVGAGYGAAYGFGSADGSLADRLAGAVSGGVSGGATGFVGGSLAQRLASRGGAAGMPRGVSPETVAAAERQGIELVRPDVDPTRRSTYSFLESLPFSGGRVRADLQRGADQIEERIADVGGTANAVSRQTAGENLREAGNRYVERSRDVVNRLYDRADSLSGGAQVRPGQALQTIDRNIAELSETPSVNAAKLDILNRLRTDMVDDAGNIRTLSVGAIRDLRSNMRDALTEKGLRYSDTERRVMQAIDSANADIATQLQGPALRAFQRADRAYRERADLVDNVIERFIGTDRFALRSGEKVMNAVENAGRGRAGDAATLGRLMERLQPAERQEVAGTIAAQLGRRDLEGQAVFSPARFFSELTAYSPEARVAIFGRQGAADLADLARVAEARGGTLSRLNNSRSGQVGNWRAAIQSLVTGGGAGALLGGATGFGATPVGVTGAGMAGATLGGAYLTARMMGNRRVVSALAQAARAQNSPARMQAIRYLRAIAVREPALAGDILPIHETLMNAMTDDNSRQ